MMNYKFPNNKLTILKNYNIRKQAILVLCGSFNPPTFMHLRSLVIAKDTLLHQASNN